MALTSRMMKKGEEARACSVSFSSKALTMGVLKRSSAAMIVLLLFFASLPGAKGVQQGNTQSQGILRPLRNSFQRRPSRRNNTSSGVCDIPEVAEVVNVGHLHFPAAPWFVGAAEQGLKKEMDSRPSKDCNREKDIEEIAKKANEKIRSPFPDVTDYCKRIFKTQIDHALEYTSKKTRKGKEDFCQIEAYSDKLMQSGLKSCETLAGLSQWVEGLPICESRKAQLCSSLVVFEKRVEQRLRGKE